MCWSGLDEVGRGIVLLGHGYWKALGRMGTYELDGFALFL